MRTMTDDHICNFFLLFTFLTIFPTISISVDILSATQSIIHNQTLVSPGDVFELGFFTLEHPGEWYVGIWYKNIPERTYVWVANRDNPLTNSSGIFKVEDRNLVLLDQGQNLVWSSNLTKGDNPVAQLLDSGNLVLREANANDGTNNYLWQSFDYPTDTLLPDMKLGWDLNTGFNRFLTAWRTRGDPSSGDCSFKLDYHGFPEIFLWNKQEKEYRSGPWNGLRFSGVPEMKPLDYISFNFVTNQDEVYYSFSIANKNLLSRLIVTPTGALQRLTWIPDTKQWNPFWFAPKDQCDNYRECGPYGICDSNASPVCKCPKGFSPKNQQAWNLRDGSDGCVRKTDLDCTKDKFLHLPNMKMPESTTSFVDNTMNLKECEALCTRNCSCTAYSNSDIRNGGTGCVIWTGDLIDLRQYTGGGQDLFVRLAASDLGDGGNKTALIIGITVGAGVLLLGLIAYVIWKRKAVGRRGKIEKKGPHERSQDFLLNEVVISYKKEYSGESKPDELELPLFDFDTIATATDNFSDENKLGQGGFGCVYMGRLVEGQVIAVKRLSKNSGQGTEEFKNEVRLIAKLQHRNLVRLLGCCIEMDEKMLVYEYMEHRSLDSVLFNKERSSLLNWQRRFNIICGIARGLLYLHQDSRFRIIHRDLKASNILLDGEMNPKISDFGMARIFGGDQTEANTKKVVGTYGYMSPEYAMDGLFSAKSDVFSFGVLVLEVVSGKKNRGFYHSNSELNLLGHAWRSWKEGKGLELIDSAAGDTYPAHEVLRCIQVGLLCVQERAEDRPIMSTVVLMLNSDTAIMPRPKTPGFCLGRNVLETDSSTSKQDESCTVNQVTVTMLDAR
ncbi:receptor-like serine/threonine-protein kinase SD1-8 [Durio zibethinus]|uniref:Receptor-like serine/threonine-protein kinase n=1 Tax=Durio zibethinus TaxID=66656 RepID=A0A6P5X7B5_DURZI|nr:receptor-like serine/threonine-protein kinase SD1-8 [Durio zibethinus]